MGPLREVSTMNYRSRLFAGIAGLLLAYGIGVAEEAPK